MEVDVYTEFNEDIKKNIWTNFEKSVEMTPFQSFAWLNNWQQTVGSSLMGVQPQIVHLQDDGQTLAILPLGIRKKFNITILEWLGGINTDYMGPLVKKEYLSILPNKKIWSIIKHNLNSFDVIHFQKQMEHTVQFMDSIGLSSNSNKTLMAYRATLQKSWDEYFAKVNKKIRSDSRRQRRRLDEIGKVSFVTSESTQDKYGIIQLMITQKSRRYRETNMWDMMAVEEYRKFYQSLAVISSNQCKVHCAALKVDDETISSHVGLVDKDTFYYIMPAHEGGEWERYSPGRLLLLELLKWSIEKGLKVFDFTVGGEKYKKEWCNRETPLYEMLQARTLKGVLYVKALQGKRKLKQSEKLVQMMRSLRKR